LLKSHRLSCPRALGLVAVGAILLLSSCSINQAALRMAADAMTGVRSSTVFTGDDDPELVGDSLPLLIKTFELMREQLPDHEGLNVQTGSLEVMYANGFVQGPAELLPSTQFEKKKAQLDRAKKLYLRADRVLRVALEQRFPGIGAALTAGTAGPLLAKAEKGDVPLLYWESAAVMSAFALAPLDVALSVRVKEVAALMSRAYALDPDYDDGSLDEFYISFYGSLPEGLGGSKALAKQHFDAALQKDKGLSVGAYVAYAQAISLPNQDYPEFKKLLDAALAIPLDEAPAHRLVNIIGQRKAAWLLAQKDDLFVDTGSDVGAAP